MDNYMSIADATSHWTFQQKRQSSRRHEESLPCTQSELFELCLLVTWKICYFVNKVWRKSRKTHLFGILITSVWTWIHASLSLTSHPSFSIPTVPDTQTYWDGACLGVCLSVLVWFSFRILQMYIGIHTKSCSSHSIHISTSLTRCTQPLHLAFFHECQSLPALEFVLLILCHTQDFWTPAGI